MPQAPTITAQLIHIQGPLKGKIQDFSQFPILIGRHSTCQVQFGKDQPTISRKHARIERQDNRFRIVDASTNGTFVNGKRIADVYLRDGDVITFSENGPKASFLTKIGAGQNPAVPGPNDRPVAPAPDLPAGPPPAAVREAAPTPGEPPHHGPASGETVSPDQEIPVISTNAPLVIQFGPTLRSYNLLPVTIGSDPACDFVIAGDTLAGRHVQFFFGSDTYYVKDLTGRNMVTINGRPVGAQGVLAQGAQLSLSNRGPTFKFLGGGRLAEIQETPSDPSEKTGSAPEPQAPSEDAADPSKKKVKPVALFKSFFK